MKKSEILEEHEGSMISFIYEGCDLPDGASTPIEIKGKIKKVNQCQFKIDIPKYPGANLTVSDVQIDTIKTI